MSAWGSAGRAAFTKYKNALNLGLLRQMMSSAYHKTGPEGGAYGAYTAFNRWTRGYAGKGERSTIGMIAARKGTVMGTIALGAGIFGGGILGGHRAYDVSRGFSSRKSRKPSPGTMY